jgi:hypothetical protein
MGLKRLNHNKKGFMFTLDALFASLILVGGLILISQHLLKEHPKENLEYLTTDILSALSELKMSEINSTFVSTYLSNPDTNTNLSVLEQIGTYWATNSTNASGASLARILSDYVLNNLLPNNTGLNLTIQESPYAPAESLFDKSGLQPRDRVVGGRMITGIKGNVSNITGSTSSAYLQRIHDKRTSSFAYFGGFIGQGNITVFSDEIPSDITVATISSIEMELDAANPFSLFINSVKCGDFTPLANNMSPDYWNITSCKDNIMTGRNLFKLNFSGNINKSYVAGGFIKINYITSERLQNISVGSKSYSFPGIMGVANLYDSFYVPGTLTNMSVKLHFNSNSNTYLTIGDVIVYQNYSSGEMTILMNDSRLKEFPVNLNYDELSNKTIPIKFASYNDTFTYVIGSNADVVLITDLSGSMAYKMNSWSSNGKSIPLCTPDNITNPNSSRLGVAGCLDSQVNAIIMNSSRPDNTNRLWLVDFSENANNFFSSQLTLLTEANIENEIYDRYKSNNHPSGGTCLCCAINQAYAILNQYSNASRIKSVIVMSDGVPTYCCGGYSAGWLDWRCNETGTGTNKAWPAWWQSTGCIGDAADCTGNDCNGPMNNAINSAARLHDNLNVTVYAIGMGPLESCFNANRTMHRIAEEGNGTVLVSSDGAALQKFYQNISFDILGRVEQSSQLVSVQGNLTISTLYNDSYINFTYTPVISPPQPNEISVLVQSDQFGSCAPNITIPPGIRVADAKIVSYSDYHWTSALLVDGTEVYNLTGFSSDYTRLGDPYEIQVPVNLLTNGNHSLFIETGDSPANRTNCSKNNSLIYTALVPSSTARSSVVQNIIGCNWTIQFEDDTFSNKIIPVGCSGQDPCPSCSYTATNHSESDYDTTDAYDIAVYNLLRDLDFDDNGKIFVDLDAADIEIVITTVSSVPYLWGPAIVKANVWQ